MVCLAMRPLMRINVLASDTLPISNVEKNAKNAMYVTRLQNSASYKRKQSCQILRNTVVKFSKFFNICKLHLLDKMKKKEKTKCEKWHWHHSCGVAGLRARRFSSVLCTVSTFSLVILFVNYGTLQKNVYALLYAVPMYGMWQYNVIILFLWKETKTEWLFRCTEHPPWDKTDRQF